MVDGDEELLAVQPEFPGNQVPGKFNGVLLEIVAEGEVAEHLEEGVVACRIADIFEVIVFAAGPNAFLRCHRPVVPARLEAGEQVLELHHAGIGEHQCRVVLWHQRA